MSTFDTATPAPTTLDVQLRSGRVRGIPHPGGAAFLGIPFAEAPVGSRRFAAPVPVGSWNGMLVADRYGPTPQRRPFGDETTIPEPTIPGEATLSVNVFIPEIGEHAAGLPVFVWIHGGGFFAGSPASPWYDGRSFVRDGVVVVTLSYRLGFDGFGWIEGAPLNRGILDQIAALEWVQENIGAFGGDPARVTIGGQSVGGASVLTLLTSPRARGLFAGVISESGPTCGVPIAEAKAASFRMAEALGVTPDLDGYRSLSEEAILDKERDFNTLPTAPDFGTPVSELVDVMRDPAAATMDFAFSPVADGEVVALDMIGALGEGAGSDVPLLLGATRDEFAFPLPVRLAEIVEGLGSAGVPHEALAGFLADVAQTGERFARSRLGTSHLFRVPAVRISAARRKAGAGDRTWRYDFGWRSPVTGTASHCYEIPFAWDVLHAAGVAEQFGQAPPQELADRMHADWTEFITHGTASWQPAGGDDAGALAYGERIAYDPEAYAFEHAVISSARVDTGSDR